MSWGKLDSNTIVWRISHVSDCCRLYVSHSLIGGETGCTPYAKVCGSAQELSFDHPPLSELTIAV